MKIEKYSTGGGIVIDGDHLLLLNRPDRNEVRLPKGHIDPGETAAQTALRETTEESGYAELAIVADLGAQVVEFDYQDKHFIRLEHYFLLKLMGPAQHQRSPLDEAQFQPLWVPLAQAVALLTYPAEQQVAQKALEWLAKNQGTLL